MPTCVRVKVICPFLPRHNCHWLNNLVCYINVAFVHLERKNLSVCMVIREMPTKYKTFYTYGVLRFWQANASRRTVVCLLMKRSFLYRICCCYFKKKDTVNIVDRYRTRQVYVSPAVSWNVYPRPEAFDSSRYRHSWISYTWNIIDILFSDVVL